MEINALLSGYHVSPTSRWDSPADVAVAPVAPARRDPFPRETSSRAELREYPKAAVSTLSEDEQQNILQEIRTQFLLSCIPLKV
ncbi:MAG: hypothetical protein JSR37_10310 [Verrucomicrobia bacterium]|nr:hypothetical protein [Verrucomicrobiota bacterium]MBS0635915.1 hypothetical protein [Verrucomicrobiota bacterium]